MQLQPSQELEGGRRGLRRVCASPDPAQDHTDHSLSTVLSHFTDNSGPDLWSIRSPITLVEQPPRRPPGPAHVFHKPLGLPLLPPTTGYALRMGQLEVPSPILLKSVPASTIEPSRPASGLPGVQVWLRPGRSTLRAPSRFPACGGWSPACRAPTRSSPSSARPGPSRALLSWAT